MKTSLVGSKKAMGKNFHEQFEHGTPPLPSDRSTGVVFACVALIASYFLRHSPNALLSALVAAGVFFALALAAPIFLRPLNVVWMKFALLLNKVMSPLIMLLLFLIVIVPSGLIMQLFRDPLQRQRSKKTSYWIERPKDAAASSLRNQF